jgi:hypothetical protein
MKFNIALDVGAYSIVENDRGLMVGGSIPRIRLTQRSWFISLMLQAAFRVKQIRYGEPGLPTLGDFDLFIGESE